MDMADEIRHLAERVRAELQGLELVEKRMFGGITFMLKGNMLCCATNKGLMVRVGKEAEPDALLLPHARPCDGARRKMPGFVIITPEGLRRNSDLSAAVKLALRYVFTLPPKDQLPKATSRRPKFAGHPSDA
jgi:TfoX/Sxy family transcriptional regulator of competence genes